MKEKIKIYMFLIDYYQNRLQNQSWPHKHWGGCEHCNEHKRLRDLYVDKLKKLLNTKKEVNEE